MLSLIIRNIHAFFKTVKGHVHLWMRHVWENILSFNEGAYTNQHEEIDCCPYF